MAAVPHVQILTRSAERRRLWGDALAAAGILVAQQAGGSQEGQPEVELTDLPGSTESVAASAWQNGVVQVATESPRDCPQVDLEGAPRVLLPADASTREIVLACQLLAPIVRLRRVQRDATEREARWKQLADADPLTGLMNRRAFSERLVEFLRVSGGSQHCCLALLDLDRFKPVNDEVGHSAGDALLRQVAERLGSAVRNGDLVSRLGGDEFAVALFGANPAVAGRLVERLRLAVTPQESVDGGRVSASAGWAMLSTASPSGNPSSPSAELPSDGPVDSLYLQALDAADANLRAAKSAGRNRTIPC